MAHGFPVFTKNVSVLAFLGLTFSELKTVMVRNIAGWDAIPDASVSIEQSNNMKKEEWEYT